MSEQMTKQNKSLIDFINPSRNYLTLIIILIVFVSLAISVGFGLSSANLDNAQRWLFILFLIFFPVFGLILALWLILRHFRKLTVDEKDEDIPWQIMSAERQQWKLNSEVNELAEELGIGENQLNDLRSAYIVAEDLALRKIELEEGVFLRRHITLDRTDFDAILVNENIVKCIDVTFAISAKVTQDKINAVLRKAGSLRKNLDKLRPDSKVVLMVVIVTQLDTDSESELRKKVKSMFTKTPVDVDIRFPDFEGLQKTFAA